MTADARPIRHAVVTGGTGGIGRWIALGLAGAGYRVILVGRDPSRLQEASGWIAGRTDAPPPIAVLADLSLLSETRQAAARIMSLAPRLDILVNNAGILSPRRVETVEGHELTLAVNHLAPFVLTHALLPALEPAMGRIVMVGSSMSDRASIDPDNLELKRRWRMTRAYGRSKLAMLMTSLEIATRLRGTGVSVNVVHPGTVATGLVRSGGIDQLAWKMMGRFALSPSRGAETPLHAALSPELVGVSGRYLKRRAVVAPNRLALDPALRARVLAATERLV